MIRTKIIITKVIRTTFSPFIFKASCTTDLLRTYNWVGVSVSMMSSPGVEEGGTLLGSSCITPILSNYLTIYTAPVEHHGPRRTDEVVRNAGQPAGGVGQPVVRPGQGTLVYGHWLGVGTCTRCRGTSRARRTPPSPPATRTSSAASGPAPSASPGRCPAQRRGCVISCDQLTSV